MLCKKIIQIFIVENIEFIPVIEPCAPELCIVNAEAQRMNQMQRCTGDSACPRDAARILRDARLNKNKMQFMQNLPILFL